MTTPKPEPVAWLYADDHGGRVACPSVIEPPFEGWTETPLYPASALDKAYRRGQEDMRERAARGAA